ncbi:helix-turn-helix domain-containing protein [Dankookia sp. P2]|uniref:helix-turn-helix domain-containing protein n=1 Tax=Dankookia sp. P2 TaxID=3423955 RepID=UPI003D6685BD
MHPAAYKALRAASTGSDVQLPEAVPLPRAPAIFGLSRSTLYRLAGEGRIRFMKVGRTTLVDAGTVRDFLASLPTASIRAPQQAA